MYIFVAHARKMTEAAVPAASVSKLEESQKKFGASSYYYAHDSAVCCRVSFHADNKYFFPAHFKCKYLQNRSDAKGEAASAVSNSPRKLSSHEAHAVADANTAVSSKWNSKNYHWC